MKKELILIILIYLILNSCSNVVQEEVSPIGESNDEFLKVFIESYEIGADSSLKFTESASLGDTVGLYNEMVNLFDPDNFDCGCEGKLKKKIQNLKTKGRNKKGFVPKIVLQNAFYEESVIKLKHNAGINVLLHSFYYEIDSGVMSQMIFAEHAPTKKEFDAANYVELDNATYPSFLYTMDCSGFVSAAIQAKAGFDKASIEASADGAITKETSIFVIGGVFNCPLYEAYISKGSFEPRDSITISKQIKELQAILTEMEPDLSIGDSTKIYLNVNYQVIFASNQGESQFNRKAEIEGKGNLSVGVASGSTDIAAGVDIKSKSTFSNYSTYVANVNIGKVVPVLTVKDINTKIDSLKVELSNISFR